VSPCTLPRRPHQLASTQRIAVAPRVIHIYNGLWCAYQEAAQLQAATVLQQAFSSLHETIQDPWCSLQGGGTGTCTCSEDQSLIQECNWAEFQAPIWSHGLHDLAAASAVLQQETTSSSSSTQQDQPSTSGRSKLTTEEWRAKYEKDGAVDLFLVDHFNAAMVVSGHELCDAIAVALQGGTAVHSNQPHHPAISTRACWSQAS
jgi:hypothetical protein